MHIILIHYALFYLELSLFKNFIFYKILLKLKSEQLNLTSNRVKITLVIICNSNLKPEIRFRLIIFVTILKS